MLLYALIKHGIPNHVMEYTTDVVRQFKILQITTHYFNITTQNLSELSFRTLEGDFRFGGSDNCFKESTATIVFQKLAQLRGKSLHYYHLQVKDLIQSTVSPIKLQRKLTFENVRHANEQRSADLCIF